jgi:transposase IS481 family protein
MDVHKNARPTMHCRALLVDRVLKGINKHQVAHQFGVSVPTVNKWLARYWADGPGACGVDPAGRDVARQLPRASKRPSVNDDLCCRRRAGLGRDHSMALQNCALLRCALHCSNEVLTPGSPSRDGLHGLREGDV